MGRFFLGYKIKPKITCRERSGNVLFRLLKKEPTGNVPRTVLFGSSKNNWEPNGNVREAFCFCWGSG